MSRRRTCAIERVGCNTRRRDSLVTCAPCGAATALGAHKSCDGVEPGAEAVVVVQSIEHAVGTDEGLLQGVVGVRVVTERRKAQRPHHGCVTIKQAGEGLICRCLVRRSLFRRDLVGGS